MAGPRIPGKLRAVPVAVDGASEPTTQTQMQEQHGIVLPDVAPIAPVKFEQQPEIELPDRKPGLEEIYGNVAPRDPERSAKVIDLARKMQEPEAFIDKNLDNAVKVASAPQSSFFAQLEQSYPGTTKYLSDPNKMSAVHDDLENLAQHEQLANGLKQANGILESAQAGFQASATGLTARGAMPDLALPENASIAESLAAQVGTLAGDFPLMVAGSIVGAPAGATVGATAGSIAGPVGLMAGFGAGAAAGAMAGGFALPAAYKTALMEHFKNGDIKSTDDLINRTYAILKEAAKEGAVGVITAGAAGVAGRAVAGAAVPKVVKSVAPVASEVVAMTTAGAAIHGEAPTPRNFLETAILIGGMHGAAKFGGNAMGYYVAERKAAKAKEFYLAMGATAEASKLRARLPAEHRAYIEAVVKDGPVQDIYIPVEAIDKAFGATEIARPEGIRQPTVEQIMNQAGLAEAYREAKVNGGDVKIPLGQWVEKVVGTEYYQKLADDVKFSPESLSVNDIREVEAQVEARVQEMQRTARLEESSTAVRENIEKQLTEAGLTKEEIANNPLVHEAFYRTLGERLGEDPLALAEQFPLTVNREIEGQTFAQGEAPPAPAFYSKLIQTVEQKMGASATVEQVRGMLKEIKPEEMKWLGLDEALVGKDKISKQELLDQLRANQLSIQEVTKKEFVRDEAAISEVASRLGELKAIEDKANEEVKTARDAFMDKVFKKTKSNETAGAAAREVAKSMRDENPPEKYYGVDAKKLRDAYRRQSEAFQARQKVSSEWQDLQNPPAQAATKFQQYTLPGGTNYREVLFTLPPKEMPTLTPAEKRVDVYRSGHFDESNIIAHTRLNDRVDADGKRVLFVEEIQSDLHQEGRRKGYRGEKYTEATLPDGVKVVKQDGKFVVADGTGFKDLDSVSETRDGAAALWSSKRDSRPPEFPFKKTWHEFVLKRLIREAAEKGYDKIAWTTGEQQAARYDLSKQLESVTAKKSKEFQGQGDFYDVVAKGKNGEEVFNQTTGADNLENLVGKDLAAKIIADGGGKYSGLDLKVGGEGMKGFYDKILVDAANKLAKKFGRKVGESEISTPPQGTSKDAQLLSDLGVEGTAKSTETVHSLEITPALKAEALNQGFSLFQSGETPRGRIQIQGQNFNIDLLSKADRSTFIHETGHYFTEIMKNIAERESTPQRIKDDFATLREFVGAKEGESFTVEQHEKLARGFEKYLAEGKAPSAKLERAFNTFKRWLVKIYQDLRGLNVELTDDVRAVFDRMLATDKEIAEAQRAAGYVSELSQQIPENIRNQILDVQLQARERAESQLLKEQMKELTAAHREKIKEERAKATKEAEAKVDGLPLFTAQAEVTASVGTEKRALADAQRLLDGKLKDPTSFEVAAEKNGFADGESLAREMIEARDTNLRTRSVDALVAEAMAPFAELRDTQKIRELALEAIHNEKATELLALERAAFQEILDRKITRSEVVRRNRLEARIEAQAAKEYARQTLAGKSVKDATKASIYVTAERNAAVKAERAIKNGDLESAVEYKRQQMVNHALAAEAMRNKVEAEKAFEYFKPFEKRGTDLMNMPYGTIRQIDGLLAKYGVGPARSEDTTGLRATANAMLAAGESVAEVANRTGLTLDAGGVLVSESLPQFVARVNENYFSLSIPESVQQTAQKAPGDMSMRELRDLRASVKAVAEVGRKYERFLGDFETADIREAARQFRAQIEEKVGTPYAEAKAIGFKNSSEWGDRVDAITNLPDAIVPELVNILTLTHYLDGATEGKAKDFIYRPLKAAEDRKILRYQKMTAEMNDIFAKFYKPEELAEYKSKREFYPEVQRNLTKENVLMMAMNWGNEGNRSRLKEGLNLSDAQVHSMFERTLEKRDWDFAQATWDYLETFWPDIQALEMKVRGEQVVKVDAAEVVNAYGTYRGGYFPLAYDFLRSSEAYKNAEKKNELYKQYSATVAHTETGHTKARAAYVKRPVLLDMQVLFNHLENVVHDLEFREAVIDVNRFLNQTDTRAALENSIGIRATKGINDWLKSVASDQGEFVTMGDKAFRWFRFGTTFATLGYRFPMVPLDLIGNVIRSTGEIGFKRTTTAIRDFLANPVETKQFVDELSPRMKQRATMRDRDVQDISRKWSGKDSAVKQFAFMFQSFADEAISYPIWSDVYKRSLEKHGHDRAVNIADETITRTFGSGSMLDRVGVQRGSEASKIMSMYYSFSSMMFNRAWLSGKLAGLEYRQGNTGAAIGTAAKAALFLWGLEGLNEALYKEFIRNPTRDSSDEDREKRIAARFLTQPFSYVWGVRDIAAFGVERALGNKTQKYRLSPLESTIETLLGTAGDTVNIAFTDREVNDKYIEDLARSSAIVFGYPQQANTVVFNLLDWAEGEGEITWRDALSRKTKK